MTEITYPSEARFRLTYNTKARNILVNGLKTLRNIAITWLGTLDIMKEVKWGKEGRLIAIEF